MINNVSVTNRLGGANEPIKKALDGFAFRMKVAAPGIIKAFDAEKQTVKVQLCIREKISINGKKFEDIEIPVLEDVPIFMPRAGHFVLTMPIAIDDECLVVFSDNCMDAWWESGDVSNQIERRRHDLSDGFALLGVWSQPHKISGYSVDSAVLRNLSNDSYIEVKDTVINIVTPSEVNVEANTVNVNAGNEEHTTAPIVNIDCTSHRLNASSGSIENTGDVKQITATAVSIFGGTILLQSAGGATIGLSGTNSTVDGKNFLNHTHKESGGSSHTYGVD